MVEPDGTKRSETIRVNHPVTAGGANVYLSGNGFAPVITVRDGAGKVAFSGAVPFLPQDGTYTSKGVVKVPDVSTGDQLGMTGMFLPTALVGPDGTAQSIYPQPDNPMLALTLYAGDLGLDNGVPQNVYVLDTEKMRQVYEPAPDGTTRLGRGRPEARLPHAPARRDGPAARGAGVGDVRLPPALRRAATCATTRRCRTCSPSPSPRWSGCSARCSCRGAGCGCG